MLLLQITKIVEWQINCRLKIHDLQTNCQMLKHVTAFHACLQSLVVHPITNSEKNYELSLETKQNKLT